MNLNSHFRKTVAVVVEYFPPRLGADRRIFEIMRRLSNDYRIFFVSIPTSYIVFIKQIEEAIPRDTRTIIDNIEGYRIGLPTWLRQLWKKSFFLSYVVTQSYLFFKLLRRLSRCRPDVIVIRDTSVYAGLLGIVCSRILMKDVVVDFDDLKSTYTAEVVKGLVHESLMPLVRGFLVFCQDMILKRASRVTALSSYLVSYAARRGIRRDLILIPDGVDLALFDPHAVKVETIEAIRSELGVNNKAKLCVYAGRIDVIMGSDILHQAAYLLQSNELIRFLIIGEGDSSLIRRLASLKNVVVMKPIPIERIPEYLAAADIILVPYPDKPTSHAASPLKLLEGLAMEKPVIAAAVSGIKEIVQGSAILVSDDPRCWAEVILEVASQYDRYVHIGRTGRDIVRQRYDWNRLARMYCDAIEGRV